MTTSDKIVSIAKNVLDIHKAGEIAVLYESAYMHPNICGTIISVNDVTPIEHNVGVKLENKNLYNINATTECYTSSFALRPTSQWSVENETLFVKYGLYGGAAYWNTNITHLPKGLCTLSCDVYIDEETDTTSKEITLGLIITKDGNKTSREGRTTLSALKTWERVSYTFNLTEDVEIMALQIQPVGNASNYTNLDTYFKNIKLVLGTETAYTPYVEDFSNITLTRAENIGKYVFTGEEAFYLAGSGFPYGFYAYNYVTDYNTTSNIQIWCTHFECVHNTLIDNENATFTFCQYNQNWYFNYDCQKGGVANFKEWLRQNYKNGTPVTVYYKKIDTTDEDFTDYTANADGTVEGVKSISPNMTLISSTNGVTIDCTYYRDIDTYVNDKMATIALFGGV